MEFKDYPREYPVDWQKIVTMADFRMILRAMELKLIVRSISDYIKEIIIEFVLLLDGEAQVKFSQDMEEASRL